MPANWLIYAKGSASLATTLAPHVKNLVKAKMRSPLDATHGELIDWMIKDTQSDLHKALEEIDKILLWCEEFNVPIDQKGTMAMQAPKHLSFWERRVFTRHSRRLKRLCDGFNASMNDLSFRIHCFAGKKGMVGKPIKRHQASQVSESLQNLAERRESLHGTSLNIANYSVEEVTNVMKEYVESCNTVLSRLSASG